MCKSKKFIIVVLYLFSFFSASQLSAAEEPFTADIAVEKTDVYLGEPFIVQIQVNGSDSPDKPDMSGITDFSIQEEGSRNNTSSSITIINGRMTKKESHGYIFSYRFTAKKTGDFIIPSLTVSADGKIKNTRSVQIKVAAPTESQNFKLTMETSSPEAYVGQPITVKLTWYIGKDVKDFQFSVPLLTDPRFIVVKTDTGNINGGGNLIRIPVDTTEVIGEKGKGTLDNKTYTTVSFKKTIIPAKAGTFTLPQATVFFTAIMGYERRRGGGSPFDSFFGDDPFFGNTRRETRKKFVVPSNTPTLTVNPLPETGQPHNYNGLVGEYTISAEAKPVNVQVGDPITITLKVTGEDYLENVKLPSLKEQKNLATDFKISEEMASGTIDNGVITFTQTIRAKHTDIKEIPAVELPFFDTQKKEYRVARTKPIPLTVKRTRVVTVKDAEGLLINTQEKIELKNLNKGIAHNYDDLSVLTNERFSPEKWVTSPLLSGIIFFPPFVYSILFAAAQIAGKRKADPAGRKRRRAYSEFLNRLNECGKIKNHTGQKMHICIADSLREYLGSKLAFEAVAITYSDVKEKLEKLGTKDETLERLKKIFEEGEAMRFAGGSEKNNNEEQFLIKVKTIAKEIEDSLK